MVWINELMETARKVGEVRLEQVCSKGVKMAQRRPVVNQGGGGELLRRKSAGVRIGLFSLVFK